MIMKVFITDCKTLWKALSLGRYIIIMMMLLCYDLSSGQLCIDRINIAPHGYDEIGQNRLAIIPRLNFTCNGRITSITARVIIADKQNNYPSFQVWRPSLANTTIYNKIGEIQLQPDDQVIMASYDVYLVVHINLTNSNRIEFQSGDVVGYYHPPHARYQVRNVVVAGYVTYHFDGIPALNSVNLTERYNMSNFRRPLLQFNTDIRCYNLSTPINGGITSCSSGRVGVGYEGDTCSFTCNTGYELTGNDTRTCQNNGSWSSSDAVCRRVSCSSLTYLDNGTLNNCSLGDDGVPSYEDTCSFTCNTGYEVTGSDTRTCQSDGSWSGSDQVCRRASEISGSGSSGAAAAGGGVGGILFIIITIIIVVLVIFYIRQLKRKKAQLCKKAKGSRDVKLNVAEHEYQNTITLDNEAYGQSIAAATSPCKAVYEKPRSPYHIILNVALSTINEPQYENLKDWCELSSPPPQEIARSIEKEEEIYNTPYEDEGDYGPVYHQPPSDERKIYAEFEGKRFRKLYHREIRSFEELGIGEFGVITHCKWKPSANKEVEVAVKTLKSTANDKERLRFLQEAAIMCQFDHENVIKLYGVVTEAPIMIVLEYMPHGDLQDVLTQLQPIKGITAHAKLPLILLKFCNEISAGMTYLSGKQFIHRDLAARNILVSEKITCKIADFGMARDLIDDNCYITSGGKIPVKWTAPEALEYKTYSVRSDVWSYGCVLYEVWSLGCKPFKELTNLETLRKIDHGFRLPPPPGCPRTIYRVMIKCWNPEPRSRPQFGQITKLLSSDSQYLLSWSDEDKQSKDAMKLGAPLEAAYNLYYDLQLKYKQINKMMIA